MRRERYEIRSGRFKGYGKRPPGAENRVSRWLSTGNYEPHGFRGAKRRVERAFGLDGKVAMGVKSIYG